MEQIDSAPLVSICCMTYNHESFIRDAIEGFLLQKTGFPVEVIIHDDASTDGTGAIVKEYAEKHPDLLRPIWQNENQYSKGIKPSPTFVWPKVRGKYIAFCEGDDYWIDPLKLQKQVDFLETHPDFIMCVGGYIKYNLNTKEQEKVIVIPPGKTVSEKGYEFTLDDVRDFWITKTLTLVFRNEKEILDQFSGYRYGRDTNLVYHLLKGGQKGFYFTEIMGVYRIHEGGVFSLKGEAVRRMSQYLNYKELYQKNRDEFTRVRDFRFTLSLLNYDRFNRYPGNTRINRMKLFLESLRLSKNLKEIRLVLSAFSFPRPH